MAQMASAMFDTREDARRAVHALRDHGVDEDCISVLAVADDGSRISDMDQADRAEAPGKDEGISTTTPGDAGKGAAEGAAIGAGLGIAAALASIFVPGFGLIAGGGALATALSGAAAATAGGAIAGGVTGYLSDMGVPSETARVYEAALKQGGVLVAVQNTDEATPDEVQQIFDKYNGRNVSVYQYAGLPVADPDDLDAANRRLTEGEMTDETLVARRDEDDLNEDFDAVTGSEGSASSRLDNRDVGLR